MDLTFAVGCHGVQAAVQFPCLYRNVMVCSLFGASGLSVWAAKPPVAPIARPACLVQMGRKKLP